MASERIFNGHRLLLVPYSVYYYSCFYAFLRFALIPPLKRVWDFPLTLLIIIYSYRILHNICNRISVYGF